jgi:ATP-dependent DNA helicase RecQ
MLRSGEEFDVSRYDLSQDTDIRPLVVETVITYLELDGLLRPIRAFYESTQVQFLKPEAEVLRKLDTDRARFLSALFAAGSRGRKYLTVDLEEVSKKIGEPREKIAKALTWLEETGAIMQKPAGLRHAFRLCAGAADRDPASVAARQAELFAQREARDSQRLAQILEFARESGCITRRLLSYFGETLAEDSCGHCHFCRTGEPANPVTLPATPIPPFTNEDREQIRALILAAHRPLATPRQITRFLCGLTSPATSRSKLTRLPTFGRFATTPFRLVLAEVERLFKETGISQS